MGISYINLRDLGAFTRPGILYAQGNGDRSAGAGRSRRNLQIAIFKRGVRETESKGKARFHRRVIVVSVAKKNPFGICNSFLATLGVVAIEGGIVFPPAFEGNGKFAGRTVITEENLRQCGAALLSRIPGVEQRGNLVDPTCHVNVSTGSEDNNDILVGLGDLLNEVILTSGQAKRTIASLTFRRWIEAHAENHHICFFGQGSSLFPQRA